jgi:hypothetical protein
MIDRRTGWGLGDAFRDCIHSLYYENQGAAVASTAVGLGTQLIDVLSDEPTATLLRL